MVKCFPKNELSSGSGTATVDLQLVPAGRLSVGLMWACQPACSSFRAALHSEWVIKVRRVKVEKKDFLKRHAVHWTLRPSVLANSVRNRFYTWKTLLCSVAISIYRPWQKFNIKHISSCARRRVLHPSRVPTTTKASDIRASEPVSLGACDQPEGKSSLCVPPPSVSHYGQTLQKGTTAPAKCVPLSV